MEHPHRETNIGRDLTHTGLYVIESDHASSTPVISLIHPGHFIYFHIRWDFISAFTHRTIVSALTRVADTQISTTGGDVTERTLYGTEECQRLQSLCRWKTLRNQFSADEEEEVAEDPLHYEDPVMHISGAGHLFLEGWIGDHSVEFLVDSGSSVTAISDVLYGNLLQAGAPVGALQATARTLRSANGTGIEVLGCSRCSVSFLGLRTEFPIIICSLAADGRDHWDRCVGIGVATYARHQERTIIYTGWSVATAAPAGFGPVGSCVHGGAFVNTTIFGGCLTLLCPDHWVVAHCHLVAY